MKVNSTGRNLSILIVSDYSEPDSWMSFGSWYSISQFLPDAKILIMCSRILKDNLVNYNWTYRCNVKFFQHSNFPHLQAPNVFANKFWAIYLALRMGYISQPFLVIDNDILATREITKNILLNINNPEITFAVSGTAWYFNNQSIEVFHNLLNIDEPIEQKDSQLALRFLIQSLGEPKYIDDLCGDCINSNPTVLSQYRTRCGLFNKDEWIRGRKSHPFQLVHKLKAKNMTANEKRILGLWRQMRCVYDVVR